MKIVFFNKFSEDNFNNTGIYEIISKSGKSYVGMTRKSFKHRLSNHIKLLKQGKHKCIGLQNAFFKYKDENFIFRICCIIPKEEDISIFYKKELEEWGKKDNRYNGQPTMKGGIFHSQDSKLKTSISVKRYLSSVGKSKKEEVFCKNCKNKFILIGKKIKKFCSTSCQKEYFTKIFDIKGIISLYEKGYSLAQISKLYKVSKITIRNYLMKEGIKIRSNCPHNRII